jgi:hypothetical protein
MKFSSFVLFLILFAQSVLADEICSRTATINYQEVLIDTSSSKLGEGLRFYLEKDPEALKLLEEYQSNNKIRWLDAAMSTSGTGLILFGLLKPGQNSDSSSYLNRQSLVMSGVSLILISYLVSKTINYNNEKYLQKSIEEYNKRNTPRIYFSPLSEYSPNNQNSIGLTAGLFKDF